MHLVIHNNYNSVKVLHFKLVFPVHRALFFLDYILIFCPCVIHRIMPSYVFSTKLIRIFLQSSVLTQYVNVSNSYFKNIEVLCKRTFNNAYGSPFVNILSVYDCHFCESPIENMSVTNSVVNDLRNTIHIDFNLCCF